jgi:hypothetical protein
VVRRGRQDRRAGGHIANSQYSAASYYPSSPDGSLGECTKDRAGDGGPSHHSHRRRASTGGLPASSASSPIHWSTHEQTGPPQRRPPKLQDPPAPTKQRPDGRLGDDPVSHRRLPDPARPAGRNGPLALMEETQPARWLLAPGLRHSNGHTTNSSSSERKRRALPPSRAPPSRCAPRVLNPLLRRAARLAVTRPALPAGTRDHRGNVQHPHYSRTAAGMDPAQARTLATVVVFSVATWILHPVPLGHHDRLGPHLPPSQKHWRRLDRPNRAPSDNTAETPATTHYRHPGAIGTSN